MCIIKKFNTFKLNEDKLNKRKDFLKKIYDDGNDNDSTKDINLNRLENAAKEIRDYKSKKTSIENMILKSDDTNLSDKIEKIITNKNTYGINKYLRAYATIAYKMKRGNNLGESIKKLNDDILNKRGEISALDRSDESFNDKQKNINDDIMDTQKKINDKNKDLSDLNKEIKKDEADLKLLIKDADDERKIALKDLKNK